MSHVWVRTIEDDLVRADEIRQFNVAGGLRTVLVGGNQFLLAETGSRAACTALAEELIVAIAEAQAQRHATIVAIVDGDGGWAVETRLAGISQAQPADDAGVPSG